MKNINFLIVCFILSFYGRSQTTKGFFGKKNIVELTGRANIPMIYNLLINDRLSSFIFDDGSTVAKSKRNWFNYGLSIQNIHYFKKSFGLGLELGIDFQKCSGPDYLEFYNQNSGLNWSGEIQHEMLKMNTITIMPKIEFGPFASTLPSGISHQLGIGFSMTKIKEMDYFITSGEIFNPVPAGIVTEVNTQLKNSKSLKGFSLLYQMTYRTPISKRLFLAWSMRYSGNFTALKSPIQVIEDLGYGYDNYMDQVKAKVRTMRMANIIQFSVAFGFVY